MIEISYPKIKIGDGVWITIYIYTHTSTDCPGGITDRSLLSNAELNGVITV